jgi:hypothetical protein
MCGHVDRNSAGMMCSLPHQKMQYNCTQGRKEDQSILKYSKEFPAGIQTSTHMKTPSKINTSLTNIKLCESKKLTGFVPENISNLE